MFLFPTPKGYCKKWSLVCEYNFKSESGKEAKIQYLLDWKPYAWCF